MGRKGNRVRPSRLAPLARTALLSLPLIGLASSAPAVTIDWVTVGVPGNGCDPQSQGCFGSVAYGYQISKYEVTNAQYAEFLNAVASNDIHGLYSTNMGSPNFNGGITQACAPGGNAPGTYGVIAGRGDMPVNWVSFYDAMRFANWLHNGKPTGAQDDTTTEDGAYTFSGHESVGARNAGAAIFIPSEDEWYKAAYYDAASTSYFDYPAGSDTQTTCATPTATPNRGNCNGAVGDLTDVGSYTGSASPYGTFDQGGNVFEWNEAIVIWPRSSSRAVFRIGFRVAMVSEPGTGLLVIAGLLALALVRKAH